MFGTHVAIYNDRCSVMQMADVCVDDGIQAQAWGKRELSGSLFFFALKVSPFTSASRATSASQSTFLQYNNFLAAFAI